MRCRRRSRAGTRCRTPRAAIDSPPGWLVTVTTGSASTFWARRELVESGTWASGCRSRSWPTRGGRVKRRWPRPPTADRVSLEESLSMALRVVLESMTPAERVASSCTTCSRYTFAEVAQIVGRSPAACRQLASSARARIRDARRTQITTSGARSSGDRFAGRAGNWRPARRSSSCWIRRRPAIADGGGLVAASVEPVEGADAIARYLLDLYARGVRFRLTTVNARAGLVGTDGSGEPLAVASLRSPTGGSSESG